MSRQFVRFALVTLSLAAMLAVPAPGGASPLAGIPLPDLAAWWGRLTGGLAGLPAAPSSATAGRRHGGPGPRTAPGAPALSHPAHPRSRRIVDEGFGVDPNGRIDSGGPH